MNSYQILSSEAVVDGMRFELLIPAKLRAFEGHFPGQPILPGVVQMDWVVQLAITHLGLATLAARDFKVKFNRMIRPDMALSVELNLNREKGQLHFTYRSGAEVMSSGQIKVSGA